MTTKRQRDKAVRVFERSRKGRSEAAFCLLQEKKRQSTKLKGSKLKASKRQDVFVRDGQFAAGARCQESVAHGGLRGRSAGRWCQRVTWMRHVGWRSVTPLPPAGNFLEASSEAPSARGGPGSVSPAGVRLRDSPGGLGGTAGRRGKSAGSCRPQGNCWASP